MKTKKEQIKGQISVLRWVRFRIENWSRLIFDSHEIKNIFTCPGWSALGMISESEDDNRIYQGREEVAVFDGVNDGIAAIGSDDGERFLYDGRVDMKSLKKKGRVRPL